MPELPILAGIGGSRGRIFLRLVMATSSFLTGRVQAMQVWGQGQQSSLMRSVLWCGSWSLLSSGAPVYSSVKWRLCCFSPLRQQV